MSGTSSHLVLEKENGVYSITVNYDSNSLLFYLYLIHNKRSNWEYIIEKGSASFIGYSLTGREKDAEFENWFSRFYYEQDKSEDDLAVFSKNLKSFCSDFCHESFTFFMDINDNIFVSSQYYIDDEDHKNDFKHKPENFMLIDEFIEKHVENKTLESYKLRIQKKRFRGGNILIECKSKEDQDDKFEDLKKIYKDHKIFKDTTSFDIYMVYRTKRPYHEKQY